MGLIVGILILIRGDVSSLLGLVLSSIFSLSSSIGIETFFVGSGVLEKYIGFFHRFQMQTFVWSVSLEYTPAALAFAAELTVGASNLASFSMMASNSS